MNGKLNIIKIMNGKILMITKVISSYYDKICSGIKNFFYFFFAISLFFVSNGYSQTVSVSGRVTASRFSVSGVSITFIDNSDTTVQYSTITDDLGKYELGLVTFVSATNNTVPAKVKLGQSYPNPFSSSAAIPYGLNKESNVRLTIYDILGRVVCNYEIGPQSVGTHSIIWDGRNSIGQQVATGIYFYKLKAGNETQVKKMIFNRNGTSALPISNSISLADNEQLLKLRKVKSVQSDEFIIRLQNTNTTTPLIVPQEFKNVVIQSDTTINFAVENRSVSDIDFDSLRQIIRGFGASNIVMWRPDMTESEIEKAFGTGDGQLGFTILRLMVEPDSNRWSFSLPSAKKAYEMGATIIAAPWYAPNDLSEDVGNINRVRHDKYAEYAEHLNSFVRYMKNNGVDIYGISIQNEPDIEENWTSWTADEMFSFMKDYAQAIEGTNVMAPESFHFDRSYSDPILNNPVAEANTDIIAGHIYGSGLARYPLAEEKGKEVWMTEHLSGENSTPDDWTWALNAGIEMNDVMKVGMSAYVWWYLVRYYGPISDGTYLRQGEITKKGYVMSQFARFIRPGFYRVKSSTSPPSSNVEISAYKDPSSSKIVIVAINTGSSAEEHTFRIQNNEMMTTFTPYITSESKDCEQGEVFTITENFTLTLEPLSITTFVSK